MDYLKLQMDLPVFYDTLHIMKRVMCSEDVVTRMCNIIQFDHKSNRDHFFEEAERKFHELTALLKDGHTLRMKFSEIEKLIEKDGRELMRLLLQGHVDSRGMGDIGSSIEGTDNVARTHKRIGVRQIKSIFGPIEIQRTGYGNRGVDSLFPKDGHLNLPENSHSHELQRRIALEVVKGSFDSSVESIIETTGQLVHKQQIEHITVAVSQDFDAFYQANLSAENLKIATEAPLLILTTDGKGVVMHKDDLRLATRKKAESADKKLENRLSPGEKKNSKRMATVASVYNIDRFVRSPEDFKKELSSIKPVEEEPVLRPKPLAKRVWASIEKSAEEVIQEVFDEGLRRDPSKKKIWVALVDGAPTQIRQMKSAAKVNGVSLTIVCDVIHVVEYLWKAVWAFFEKGDRKAESWVNERFIKILEGKATDVAAGIRRTATKRKLSKSARETVDKCADYLINKSPYLHYNKYLEQGFPIATGIIEGACRYLIKDRMDITGARWRMTCAEAVLKLRSLKASGDFNEYWQFHEQQEFIRNHQAKYGDLSFIKDAHDDSV
jgi:hypothetical protein